MTTIYILAENHMDPVWKRCFRRTIEQHGIVMRPYAELEALAFNAWFDLCRGGAKYGIETTLTVREYLERHPERRDEVISLVRDGTVEIYGGGEAVVDYNLADGETIVRSHTQAIRWCQEIFGLRPVVGLAPDTFGLSAQTPQIFRGLGYRSLMRARLMDSGRPYWRGLDGCTIYVGRNGDLFPDRTGLNGPGVFTAPASCCAGVGCPACLGVGLNLSPRLLHLDEEQRLRNWMTHLDKPETMIFCLSEEVLPPPDFAERMADMARNCGHQMQWATQSDILGRFAKTLLDSVDDPGIPSDQIDPRAEINPLFTGCYLSRIGIKQTVRRLEDAVRSAETLAALDWRTNNSTYPATDLDRCWRDLALLAFHDALPGSHSDAAFEELMDIASDVRTVARNIANTAAYSLAGRIAVPTGAGMNLVVFMPVTGNRDGDPLTLSIPDAAGWPGVEISDEQGRRLDVVDWNRIDGIARVTGLNVPEFGWQTLKVKQAADTPLNPLNPTEIASRFHLVDVTSEGFSIEDCRLNRKVLNSGTCGLWVEEDIGSPWETLSSPSWRIALDNQPGIVTTVSRGAGWTRLVRSGTLADRLAMADRRIHRLSWQLEMTLYDASDRIDFTVEVDWDTEDCRVFLALPLPWTPPEGRATYGIPFGLLERPSYTPQPGRHGCTNGDWPVLGLVAVRDPVDDTWVAVLERGNPAAQVVKNVLRIGLMRSPSHATLGSMIEGACDKGRHRFDFALITGRGTAQELHLMERARAFNTTPVAVSLPANACGDWPSSHTLLSLAGTPAPVASCLKRSDNGAELVLRAFDPYGQGADLALNGPLSGRVRRLDMTEAPVPANEQRLHPYEIATLEIGKGDGEKSDLCSKLIKEMKT